jgi:hypothetical protein
MPHFLATKSWASLMIDLPLEFFALSLRLFFVCLVAPFPPLSCPAEATPYLLGFVELRMTVGK